MSDEEMQDAHAQARRLYDTWLETKPEIAALPKEIGWPMRLFFSREVGRLLEENAALREIVEAVAAGCGDPCGYCGEQDGDEWDEQHIQHTSNCLVTKARELLGKFAEEVTHE